MLQSTYKLINKVFSHRDLLNQPQRSTQIAKKPYITIARDPGSGGKPIAVSVAQKLRFKFYDKSLIDAISKSSKRRKQIIENVDEKTRSAIQDVIHNLFNPEYISDTTYINHLTDVVLSISHQGNAVILGRGANFIVPSQEALRVLITAPKSTRIQRAIEFEGIKTKTAKERVEKISNDRRDFVSQYFHKRYSNPNYYDLILNTEHLSIEAASSIVIAAYRHKFSHPPATAI